MNKDSIRRSYGQKYYQTHACEESFTCKNCGQLVVPEGASTDHRNHCPNCLMSVHVDNEPGAHSDSSEARPVIMLLSSLNT